MSFEDFLNEVIDRGIAAAKEDYKDETSDKLLGSVAGFEACRRKSPLDLLEVYAESQEYAKEAMFQRAENYWYFRCYQMEVEWVLNCVSCLRINNGHEPLLSHLPTCNAMVLVSKIVGVHKP